ncbi:hypothetical protein [Oceanobacillus profundus]|uniref:Permease n=1 Tax=Oceanobacillus profundus TaxID=372463 RepID=A0A417YDS2_9BACI|nr:hypothetical protein [Oceanobacillus profundus]RHW30763.1 hypothetical protein D1B32_15135 [Oceanobacillus profundus]
MKNLTNWCLTLSIITFTVLHFVTYFYDNEWLLRILSISGIGIFVFTVVKYTPPKIKMPSSLFVIGFIILFFSKTSLVEGFWSGFLQMRNIIGLLVIVPMISWVLREEPFLEAIMGFGHRFLNTSRKFYFGMISFTQVIAYFLLFGSITMMYQFVNMILKDEKGEAWEHFKGTALLRGFSLSVLWVISIPSFAYVVETMDASLSISIIQGLIISICGIFVALLFSKSEEKKYGVNLTAGLKTEIAELLNHTSNKKVMHRNVKEFIILFISLFGTIFILNFIVTMELLILIPLVVMVWIVVYYIIKGRMNKLFDLAKSYVRTDMAKQSYQLCVMLGAGFLIFALNQTEFANSIVNGIYSLQEMLPFLNILYFLPIMVILLGFVALGPLTVMVLVAGILQSIHLPYPPELIVLAITLGSSISILLSPVIMPIIMLSGQNQLSGFKNGIQFNWKFAVVLYVLVMGYVQVRVYLG